MTTLASLTLAASVLALTAVACSAASVPEEPASVEVQTDQVQTNCVKGGITCGVVGGKGGAGSVFIPPGGGVFAPDPPPPSNDSVLPVNCGDYGCKWNEKHTGCACGGAGYGLYSSVTCGGGIYACPREVYGVVRCYKYDANGVCR